MYKHLNKDKIQRQNFLKMELKNTYNKAVFSNSQISPQGRWLMNLRFTDLKPEYSSVKIKNYCLFTGRSRAIYKKFKISRIMLREKSPKGLLPGVVRSIW